MEHVVPMLLESDLKEEEQSIMETPQVKAGKPVRERSETAVAVTAAVVLHIALAAFLGGVVVFKEREAPPVFTGQNLRVDLSSPIEETPVELEETEEDLPDMETEVVNPVESETPTDSVSMSDAYQSVASLDAGGSGGLGGASSQVGWGAITSNLEMPTLPAGASAALSSGLGDGSGVGDGEGGGEGDGKGQGAGSGYGSMTGVKRGTLSFPDGVQVETSRTLMVGFPLTDPGYRSRFRFFDEYIKDLRMDIEYYHKLSRKDRKYGPMNVYVSGFGDAADWIKGIDKKDYDVLILRDIFKYDRIQVGDPTLPPGYQIYINTIRDYLIEHEIKLVCISSDYVHPHWYDIAEASGGAYYLLEPVLESIRLTRAPHRWVDLKDRYWPEHLRSERHSALLTP